MTERIITTAEELSSLPEGAVLRDVEDGTLWVRANERWVWVFGPYYGFGNEREPLQHGPSYLLFPFPAAPGEGEQ